jgi:hypothetical protein
VKKTLILTVVIAACGRAPVVSSGIHAQASAVESTDSACQVVLRRAGPDGDGTVCTNTGCFFQWQADVDIAWTSVDGGNTALLQYKLDNDSWQALSGTAGDGTASPYQHVHFQFIAMSGPNRHGKLAVRALALTPSGDRLVDHNRGQVTLSADNGYASGDTTACTGQTDAKATISFPQSGPPTLTGTLAASGQLHVDYDLDRLTTCRGTHNGYPAWDIDATVRFLPSDVRVTQGLRSYPLDTWVPEGTTAVELWFRNYTGGDGHCEAWDSNGGQNYRFEMSK